MKKGIKIAANSIAGLLFVALMVFNVEVGTTATSSGAELQASLATELAYAGPCGRRGCEGTDGTCGSYVVLEIGSITIIRTCKGVINKPGDSQAPLKM